MLQQAPHDRTGGLHRDSHYALMTLLGYAFPQPCQLNEARAGKKEAQDYRRNQVPGSATSNNLPG